MHRIKQIKCKNLVHRKKFINFLKIHIQNLDLFMFGIKAIYSKKKNDLKCAKIFNNHPIDKKNNQIRCNDLIFAFKKHTSLITLN